MKAQDYLKLGKFELSIVPSPLLNEGAILSTREKPPVLYINRKDLSAVCTLLVIGNRNKR